ncbi:MAG TPA: DinB family protein [Anaerolineales bacterium]
MNAEERSKKIDEYGEGYDLLATALKEIPVEAWDFKASEDEWSVHEVIVHMGDSESMAALRVRKLIVEPGTSLMGYEESKWAGALNYQAQSVDDSLQIIRLARATTYRLLKSLAASVFEHAVIHPEYTEPYTFDKWLTIYANHIPDHIQQIKRAHEAWKSR